MSRNNRNNKNQRRESDNAFEQVLEIRRVSKKTKGGNNISFTALVVTGDGKGKVGLGQGRAPGVADAIKKAIRLANRKQVRVPVVDGTVPFPTQTKFRAATVLLKPAPKGTGLIAGGAVRTVVEAAGITDIVSKILGTNNKHTNAKATFKALEKIEMLDKKHKSLNPKNSKKTKKTKKTTKTEPAKTVKIAKKSQPTKKSTKKATKKSTPKTSKKTSRTTQKTTKKSTKKATNKKK